MDEPPQVENEEALVALARADAKLAPLSEADLKILQCASIGKVAYFGPSERLRDPGNDPGKAEEWPSARNVRADLLRWICTNPDAKKLVHPRGIQIQSATVIDKLDLAFAEVPFRLLFARCWIREDTDMHSFSVNELSFWGSRLKSVDLDRAHIQGTLTFASGCHIQQGVSLQNAHVGEDLDFSGGTVCGGKDEGTGGLAEAVDAYSAVIGADANLSDGFIAKGMVKFTNSRIGGDLNLDGASLLSSFGATGKGSSTAFEAPSAQVRLDCDMGSGFIAKGSVNLTSMSLGGDLRSLGGAHFVSQRLHDDADTGYALKATDLQLKGNFLLGPGFAAEGAVSLDGSHTGGDLDLSGANFHNPLGQNSEDSGRALTGLNMIVDGDFNIKSPARVYGRAAFDNTQIGGDCNFSGGSFVSNALDPRFSDGNALSLARINVKGSASLDNQLRTFGGLNLQNAHITGDLSLTASQLEVRNAKDAPHVTPALNCQGLITGGGVMLRDKFTAVGYVTVLEAVIGGTLDCSNGVFSNPYDNETPGSGRAFSASRATVKNSFFMRGAAFRAEGQVDLRGVSVGSVLSFADGTFCRSLKDLSPDTGVAIFCTGLQAGNDVYLTGRFRANGAVVLDEAQVAGDLFADGGHIINPLLHGETRTGLSLSAFSVKIDRGLHLRYGFRSEGTIIISNAAVAQSVSLRGGAFVNPSTMFDEQAPAAFALRYSSVKGGIYLDWAVFDGLLDLAGTAAAIVTDDVKTWPLKGRLVIDGFVYQEFANAPRDKGRLEWVKLQPDKPFHEQPYLQLAKVLLDSGDDEGAKDVHIALEELKTRVGTSPYIERALKRIIDGGVIGYGYAPEGAIWGAAALTLLGWVIYRRSYIAGNIIPSDKDALEAMQETGSVPPGYSKFSSFIYSLENSLPIVKLGQADKWKPADHAMRSRPTEEAVRLSHDWQIRCRSILIRLGLAYDKDSRSRLSGPPYVRWFLWFQILLGWLLALLFAAGVSEFIRTK